MHDQAIRAAHFLMQHADGIRDVIVRPERIGTDQLRQFVGLVGISAFDAAHFVQDDGHACICGLPGGLRPGHAAADNMNGFDAHGPDVRGDGPSVKMAFAVIPRGERAVRRVRSRI